AIEFAASSCPRALADTASSSACVPKHGGQMFSPSSLSRCWLNLSSAPFWEGLVPSQDSSSKSFALKKDVFILSWHLSAAAMRLEVILDTVCSHLSEFWLLGTKPLSSPPIITDPSQ